jgi:tetratricopeptide (TPR) repeat protein
VASIIGREFTSAQLNSLVEDATEDRLFEILEEALSARVIEELPQSVGSYQFTHALIQETLSSELSLTRRVRLHARIAESLEDMYGSEADVHASELAYHFGQAEAVTGTLKLVHYSLVAGERALAAYAWGESQVHFERGLAAKENQPMDAETAAIVHGLAQAQAAGGDIEEIRSHVLFNLTRAFDYYAETGEIAKAIAVAEHSHSGPLSMVMTDLLSRALRLVDPNSRQEASLLSAYGLSVGINSKDIGPSKQALDRALDISRQGNHTDLEKRALANSAQVNNFHLRFHEGLENALNAIAIESENPVDHLRARLHAGYILANLGRQSEAQEQATAMLAHVETIRDRWWSARAIALNQVLAVARGDWSVASSFEDAHGRTATDWYPRALMEFQLGNFSEGQVTFDRGMEGVEGLIRDFGVVGLPVGVAAWSTPIIARITGVPDRFAEAKSAANVAISSPTGRPIRVSLARLGLALMAVELKDVSASREQYRALESLSGTMFITSSIATDRMLGLLAHTMGDLDVAMRHFEDALVFCRKAGYRPELAWTCCDYADMLRERDAEGDRAKTISLLDESLAISSELGMRPLMERVLSRREILKA